MENNLRLEALRESDIDKIVSAFKSIGWNKARSIYELYFSEQEQGLRSIFVAKCNGIFAGYVSLKWKSDYQPFRINDIPEISDLNVLPDFRRQGIATKLIQACENSAREHQCVQIGLGVGMTADYGNAQRLYVQLGYVPDGEGLHSKNKALSYSELVTVDDDLVLYLLKKIK